MIVMENVTFPDLWPWRPRRVYDVMVIKPEGRMEIAYTGSWPPIMDDLRRIDDLADSLFAGVTH